MNKILAVDIGTASVSVAVAGIESGGRADVNKVFRYHYDASLPNKSKLLLNAISKAFNDAHKFEKNISAVRVGFSYPFFAEQRLGGEEKRKNPHAEVSADEVNNILLSAMAGLPKNFEAVSCDILSSTIDGYEVSDPYGYKGETLKIDAKIFSVNRHLKTRIEELKDEFFPVSVLRFASDRETLGKLASMHYPQKTPAVLDIGAEVSFLESQALPFGIRALERKMASSFKVGFSDAESMLRRLARGTLDYTRERAVNKIINESLSELLEPAVLGSVKNRGELFVSGAGADFDILKNAIKENLKNLYNSNMNVQALTPHTFKEKFINLGALSGGKDAVLTALILSYE
ncbi:MAG: hypothetical protein AAB556_02295 [Patescibacteria group bacterium]